MKTLGAILLAGLASTTCFAQGKLQWGTDSLHLVYYDSTTGPLAGSAVSSTNFPPGITLVADLYAGTNASSLSLAVSDTFSTLPGRWITHNVMFTNIPGGATGWFQIQVRDSAFSNATAAAAAGSYAGFSQVFSAVTGASIVYRSITQTTNPVLSTWQAGTFPLASVAPGSMGAIPVGLSYGAAPYILVNPVGRVLPIGGSVTLQVQAQGAPPLTYQWLVGTNVLSGATNATLTITNAEASQSGDYKVVVTNPGGSTTSSVATLSILATLDVRLVPAISLFGAVGSSYRLEYTGLGGSTWTDLATVTITSTGQLYFDLTAGSQSARLYRLVEVP